MIKESLKRLLDAEKITGPVYNEAVEKLDSQYGITEKELLRIKDEAIIEVQKGATNG